MHSQTTANECEMDVKLAEWTRQSIVVKAALNYFGHVTRAK